MLYIVLAYLLFLCIFAILPLPAQIILFITNMFLPDPVPMLDEVVMIISMMQKLAFLGKVMDFTIEHPRIYKGIVIMIIVIIALGLSMLIKYILH